ncbi:hypothetical protein [Lysinibacillus boronitolerans]|uniref:hypothetical protein n=1 Tax=Lysinibacillus TaxID=400634 RepID=UPI002163BF5B|nr:hypothetical protein [Lysinibacillus boronitolerans]MCS1391199.1 hypothetical protein [Lysinibacillus boronitolerans]
MLIPKRAGQPVNYEVYEEYTPAEHKLELVNGVFLPFNKEREKMLALCLFNMGLQEFVTFLQKESKEELFRLLQNNLQE